VTQTPTKTGTIDSATAASLPAGLSINKTTGVISGTPTTASSQTAYKIRYYGCAGAIVDSAYDTLTVIDLTISLDSIKPDSGKAGDTLKLYGKSFGATQGSSTISMGDSSPTVISWSAAEIDLIVPSLDTGRYDFIVSDGVTADTILDWHLLPSLNPNWTMPIKVRRKSFNHIAYTVDPIFAARADSSRHLFRGNVASPSIHAKSWNVGDDADDTVRYTISAAQLNECVVGV
jgi:hypothetical protein